MLRAVGEDGELVGGVEGHEVAGLRPAVEEALPARRGEHTLDEVLADGGIVEAPFLLDGQRREALDQRGGEQPAPPIARPTALAVNAHAEEPAGGRGALQDVPVEAERGEFLGFRSRVPLHADGEILAALLDDEPRRVVVADQAQGVAGHAQADVDLRAHRHPLDERAQGLGEEGIALVPAVVAHLGPEETGRDPEPDLNGLALAQRRHQTVVLSLAISRSAGWGLVGASALRTTGSAPIALRKARRCAARCSGDSSNTGRAPIARWNRCQNVFPPRRGRRATGTAPIMARNRSLICSLPKSASATARRPSRLKIAAPMRNTTTSNTRRRQFLCGEKKRSSTRSGSMQAEVHEYGSEHCPKRGILPGHTAMLDSVRRRAIV